MRALVKAVIPEPVRKKIYNLKSTVILHENEKAKIERKKAVAKARNLEEIREACKAINFTYFLDYDDQIETKQREFQCAIDHFNIDVKNKSVLDVGPGTADSLDYAKDHGAKETFFIEEEPVFVKFAEIKGHKGIMKNYTFEPYFPKKMKNRFDLIYTKGSINCTWVDDQAQFLEDGDSRGFFFFDKWVDELKNTLKAKGGEIILVPAMGQQEERLIDPEYDLDTYYWCPDVEKYKNSYFSQTLIQKGFEVYEDIPGFTQPKAFPLAFYYKK